MKSLSQVLDRWQILLALGSLASQAQTVIAYRTLGIFGGWPVSHDESHRMVAEKPLAFLEANHAALHALLSGQGADQVAKAWIAPLSDTVQSNRSRLEQNGAARFGSAQRSNVMNSGSES